MSIDPRYISSSDLELYLVNKTTGLPLAAGTVTFYSDVNRSQLKAVYTLDGNPPNYTFVQLPNPSTLSGVGTFQDAGGNNVIPYYYPYDADGNIELYYIVVKDSGGVEQFTREAWPPNVEDGGTNADANAVNYIPNGQFLSHTDIPADLLTNVPFGQITTPETEIAQGGWYFARPVGTTSIDNVQFFRYGEFVANPTASPRYAVQIVCSTPNSADAFKDLRIRFYDVNKFSSDTQEYTFAFSGTTFNSGDFSVDLDLIKNFGTGGSPSPTTVTTITAFNINSSQNSFQFSFVFGDNSGDSIGTDNNDYIELAISFPTNISFGGLFTDFVLFFGTIDIEEFPPTTDADFMARSLTAPPPHVDGSDLYLSLVLTREGLTYDTSVIGTVIGAQYDFVGSISSVSNLLKADGSQYFTAGYSPLGIPFSRLQSRYYNTVLNQPIFGTGKNFVSTYIQSATDHLFLSTNNFGAATAVTNVSTPFTFFPVNLNTSTGYSIIGYEQSSNTVFAKGTTAGNVTNPVAGTSGFTITIYRNPTSVSAYLMFTILTIAATTLASKYFTFYTNPGNTQRYMWFTVDGVGVDPAPGGTGIKVDLKSTYTDADVAAIVAKTLSGNLISVITTTTAAGVTPGSYFTFGSVGANNYFVWYTVDSVGTKPVVGGSLGIQVDLLSADTAAIVATKTMAAINKTYFATPNLQGLFLRGYDPTQEWDLGIRMGLVPQIYGNLLGTIEADNLVAHSHQYLTQAGVLNFLQPNGATYTTQVSQQTGETGGVENRSVNANVFWLIRY